MFKYHRSISCTLDVIARMKDHNLWTLQSAADGVNGIAIFLAYREPTKVLLTEVNLDAEY
jgi:hypothetical protein